MLNQHAENNIGIQGDFFNWFCSFPLVTALQFYFKMGERVESIEEKLDYLQDETEK